MNDAERREKLLLTFKADRFLAHKYLFPHRHKDESPEFHREICDLLYSSHPMVALMAFRGGAKSTWLEEYVLLSCLFREFVFPLFVGPNWESACERLAPIRQELETNDALIELFGDQVSSPWSSDELQLACGARIKAIGAGQSMRGKKHNDERPDLAAIDDLEDEENIRTDEAIRRTERWLTGTLLPALHPTNRRVRFIGTPIHPKALIMRKCQDASWKSRRFPILNKDLETGEEKSAWPSRFPLAWINGTRNDYIKDGNFIEFQQEYMCEAEDVAGKPFQQKMIKVEPQPERFMPVQIMIDPARTTNVKRSARTGYAAWSWVGTKLIVHEAYGAFHKPDEIVEETCKLNQRFNPMHIGVESNGLEEFLMQPLRNKQLQLGGSLPIMDMRAPVDKIGFIKGLQPFYTAGDVVHAKLLPDLEMELLQFPTGRMDVPNALAYALRMRAGRPVYEDFLSDHIAPILEIHPVLPRFLLVSSRPSMTAAVLAQYVDGNLRVYHNWVRNEPPQECFGVILREAIMLAGAVKVAVPSEQFDKYTNNGLPAAIRKEHIEAQITGTAALSEGKVTPWLRKMVRGMPGFLVAREARWVINGLAGGYARKLVKGGALADFPTDDQYRVVLEALETFVGWFDNNNVGDDNANAKRYAMTADGRRYLTSLPR